MKTGLILTLVLFVMVMQILIYSSAQCEQNNVANKMKVALTVAKPPDDDKTTNGTDKGDPAGIKKADMPVQDSASDHFNRGVVLDKSGMYREAIEAYRRALMIKPDYPEAYYNLAFSYMKLKDDKSAHEEYMLLKEISPQKADDLYNKALLMVRANPDNKYVIQVGAFRNIKHANELINKLKENYLHAQIETEDGFSKVRLFGIKNREEADIMMKDISNKFRITPFLSLHINPVK